MWGSWWGPCSSSSSSSWSPERVGMCGSDLAGHLPRSRRRAPRRGAGTRPEGRARGAGTTRWHRQSEASPWKTCPTRARHRRAPDIVVVHHAAVLDDADPRPGLVVGPFEREAGVPELVRVGAQKGNGAETWEGARKLPRPPCAHADDGRRCSPSTWRAPAHPLGRLPLRVGESNFDSCAIVHR